MRFETLEEWLAWQESLHPKTIDLGLDRVNTVAGRLGLHNPEFTIITIAGTNGKGSSVAMLESILQHAGYRVAAYTSPHLLRYSERIRVNRKEADEKIICEAFERIEQARGDISLTYFEFGTLAALDIFSRSNIDIAVLEVGLGGRLDAVNIMNADIALITALAVDHTDWLGEKRETIAMEKAGIVRNNRPVVISEPDVPGNVLAYTQQLGCEVYCIGKEFSYQLCHSSGDRPGMDNSHATSWNWQGPGLKRQSLTLPALKGINQLQNASGVLMVLEILKARFPVNQQAIRQGMADLPLPGRFQVLPGEIPVILDVAHNPQAAAILSHSLSKQVCPGKTHAVIAMLHDKNIRGVLQEMMSVVDCWYVADLPVVRGEKAVNIESILNEIYSDHEKKPAVEKIASVRDAYFIAMSHARPHDRVVVFGSFYTVAEVLQQAV